MNNTNTSIAVNNVTNDTSIMLLNSIKRMKQLFIRFGYIDKLYLLIGFEELEVVTPRKRPFALGRYEEALKLSIEDKELLEEIQYELDEIRVQLNIKCL